MTSYRSTYRIHTGFRVVPLLLAALAALSILAAPLTHAADAQGAAFGIQPAAGTDPHLRFTIEPGQSMSAEVRIKNRGSAPGAALSFVANAESLVGGGFGVAPVGAPRDGATLWVDFPDEIIEIEAGAEHLRTVTVNVPADTPPGDYIIGMAVQNAPETDDSNATDNVGVSLKIVNRQAMAIMINVPGPRTPSLEIGAVSMEDNARGSTIEIALLNNGNTHLTPDARVQVSTLQGEELADLDVDFGRFYAGTSSAIFLPVEGFLPVGTYLVSTEAWDDEADIHTEAREQQLVVSPRELPNGEQATTLAEDGPIIQAPAGTTSAGPGGGSSSMLMIGVGAGVGIAVIIAGAAAGTMLLRRPRVVVAGIVPSERRADEWQ